MLVGLFSKLNFFVYDQCYTFLLRDIRVSYQMLLNKKIFSSKPSEPKLTLQSYAADQIF